MNRILTIFTILLMSVMLAGCSTNSNDEPDNPSGLFDWEITKQVYYSHGSDIRLEKSWNETLYKKSLEYVLEDKQNFEKNSTDYYRYKYAYRKLN